MTPSTPIEIRPTTDADVPAAVGLENACSSDPSQSSTANRPAQMQYLAHRESAVSIVAVKGDVIVGQAVAILRDGGPMRAPTARLQSLCVDAAHRGQGIGGRLLSAVFAGLVGRGVRRAFVQVDASNSAALTLLGHYGFLSLGQLDGYFGPGRAAVHMVADATGSSVSTPMSISIAA